jgi:hypothetical protein
MWWEGSCNENSPEITPDGIVPVLSISPMEEDHFFLQEILNGLQGALETMWNGDVNAASRSRSL